MINFLGKSILVVDDEPDFREIIRVFFQGMNAKVFEAESGQSAFELLKKEPVDLVVSDIRMKNGTGIDLINNINQMTGPKPYIVMLSGFTDISAQEITKLGAVAFLEKPVSLEQLEEICAKTLKIKI